jgi:integrase
MADGLLVVDPTLRIKLPARSPADLVIPTRDELALLLEAASPGFRAAVILGAHVGLRAAEAQGLLVEDVDFLRRTVNVRRQLVSRPTPHLAEPKTRASTRSVPVPAGVLADLAQHVEKNGSGPEGVLLHQGGRFMLDNAFNWTWRRAQSRAGLERGHLRYHWLRPQLRLGAHLGRLLGQGCGRGAWPRIALDHVVDVRLVVAGRRGPDPGSHRDGLVGPGYGGHRLMSQAAAALLGALIGAAAGVGASWWRAGCRTSETGDGSERRPSPT